MVIPQTRWSRGQLWCLRTSCTMHHAYRYSRSRARSAVCVRYCTSVPITKHNHVDLLARFPWNWMAAVLGWTYGTHVDMNKWVFCGHLLLATCNVLYASLTLFHPYIYIYIYISSVSYIHNILLSRSSWGSAGVWCDPWGKLQGIHCATVVGKECMQHAVFFDWNVSLRNI